mmetsp:Transcript_14812/g.43224  ORF Transcript_14812/g.43224 Transcript_14812/m.43224 type:complete len:311 (+) Transcript_14812:1747-2679(+)
MAIRPPEGAPELVRGAEAVELALPQLHERHSPELRLLAARPQVQRGTEVCQGAEHLRRVGHRGAVRRRPVPRVPRREDLGREPALVHELQEAAHVAVGRRDVRQAALLGVSNTQQAGWDPALSNEYQEEAGVSGRNGNVGRCLASHILHGELLRAKLTHGEDCTQRRDITVPRDKVQSSVTLLVFRQQCSLVQLQTPNKEGEALMVSAGRGQVADVLTLTVDRKQSLIIECPSNASGQGVQGVRRGRLGSYVQDVALRLWLDECVEVLSWNAPRLTTELVQLRTVKLSKGVHNRSLYAHIWIHKTYCQFL